jgi:hypothetical protein
VGGVSDRTLTLRWDGTTWSQVPSPNPGPYLNVLFGVTVLAADDAWAVGWWDNTSGVALILHWDGSQWAAVPVVLGISAFLTDISAVAPDDIWAVGSGGTGPPGGTLSLHWDGAQWTRVPSISPPLGGSSFAAVVTLGTHDVWAGGWYFDTSAQPLFEHYNDPCATPTPVGSPTPTVTGTLPTATLTRTPTAVPTATPCFLTFTDVDAQHPFYSFIRCLACRQIVSGYADGTFRPGNTVSRGQLSKIIAGAAGLSGAIPSTRQTFRDVPPTNPFWIFVERLAAGGAIQGYGCGGPGEPCDALGRPYFRWGAAATRGQIAKITATAAQFVEPVPPAQQTFHDVLPTNPFWVFVERLAIRLIIAGYGCGGTGEPCDPQNRPYFRWGNDTTRGQMSKIAATTFVSTCPPARP